MASNSKKRRRVLRVSCILAALIIAGSSFAWFTSKDEVTNRLTANSDYGVSIVESFVPPKNWLPGQEINKDVYAVNTGSIDAFVKETVKGVLDYTYEDKVAVFDTSKYDYVKLDDTTATVIDGATTEEAGGYLIWTNAKVNGNPYPIGPVNSARVEDAEATPSDVKPERWTPPATGDYIFLRSIKNDNGTTKYTYAGYHAVVTEDDPLTTEEDESKVEYYKIVIGNDPFRAYSETLNPDGTKQFVFDISVDQDNVGVLVNEDGTFESDPAISYVILQEVDSKDVEFNYFAGGSGERDYLLATYSDGMSDTDTAALETNYDDAKAAYEAAKAVSDQDSAKVADAQVELQNAIGEYNLASKKYQKAFADYKYAADLADARNALIDAANTRKDQNDTRTSTHTALDNAWSTLASAADSERNATVEIDSTNYKVFELNANNSPISKTAIVPQAVRDVIDANNPALTDVVSNLNALDSKWNEILALRTTIDGLLNDIDDQLVVSHADTIDAHMSAATLKAKIDSLNENLESLKVKLGEYRDLFANLEVAAQNADDDTVTNLIVNSSLAAKTNIDKYVAAVTNMVNYLDGSANSYYTAYNEYVEAVNNETAGQSDWEDAIAAYNAAVNTTNGAGKAYADRLAAANAITYVPSEKDITVTNDAAGAGNLNVTYSADTTADDDASINATTAANEYVTYAAMAKITDSSTPVYPTTTNYVSPFTYPVVGDPSTETNDKTVSELSSAVQTANGTKTSKQSAYDNAKADQTANAKATQSALTAMNNAKANYEDHLTASSTIAIKVLLDDNWADYWTIDPDTDGTDAVDFYLDKILLAGETSHKLIDGVELVDTVASKDYKDLTFDLNVGLRSAQVTYDANQRGYATDAVDADDNFAGMTATVDAPLTEGSTVTWDNVEGVPASNP